MAKVYEDYGLRLPKIGVVDANLPQDGVMVQSKTLIGIEVEVENIQRIGIIRDCWGSTQDGSLRNNGVEFISKPIMACDAGRALYSLMNETLDQGKCFSPRTSVHIHVDCTTDTREHVTDVVLMYSVFERLFYKFVGRQRIKNIYCVPITETHLLRDVGMRGLRPDSWEKYTGLNVKPLSEHGTIEFRHMHGTPDVRKLTIWIDLITRLKDWCAKAGTKTVRKTLAEMSDEFPWEKLIVEIFGNERAKDLQFSGLSDVQFTYQAAKQAMTRAPFIARLGDVTSAETPYFKVRSY